MRTVERETHDRDICATPSAAPPPEPPLAPIPMPMPRYTLPLLSLRVAAVVETPLALPPFSGPTLRGAFGHALREQACLYREAGPPCEACVENLWARVERHATRCVYCYLFETPAPPDLPANSGLEQAPRPFVLRSPAEETAPPDGAYRRYAPGDTLTFEVQLFGRALAHCATVVDACTRMAQRGLGDGHGRAAVREVWVQAPFETGRRLAPLAALTAGLEPGDPWPVALARAATFDGSSLTVRFMTPAELTRDGKPAPRPEFGTLMRAVCRRLDELARVYGGETPGPYFGRLVERAEAVRLTAWDGGSQSWTRYSSRRDGRQFFAGLLGAAVYEGDLRPFLTLPALRAGDTRRQEVRLRRGALSTRHAGVGDTRAAHGGVTALQGAARVLLILTRCLVRAHAARTGNRQAFPAQRADRPPPRVLHGRAWSAGGPDIGSADSARDRPRSAV